MRAPAEKKNDQVGMTDMTDVPPSNPYNDPKGYQKAMGTILKELRREQGMVQEDIGDMIGLSQRSMSDLEAGKNAVMKHYINYADCVNLDFSVLVARARLWMEMNRLGS